MPQVPWDWVLVPSSPFKDLPAHQSCDFLLLSDRFPGPPAACICTYCLLPDSSPPHGGDRTDGIFLTEWCRERKCQLNCCRTGKLLMMEAKKMEGLLLPGQYGCCQRTWQSLVVESLCSGVRPDRCTSPPVTDL